MTTYQRQSPTVEAVQWTGDIEAVRVLFPDASTAAKDVTHCLVPLVDGTGHFSVPLTYWITIDPNDVMAFMDDESFQALYGQPELQ